MEHHDLDHSEPEEPTPRHSGIRVALLALAVLQLGVSYVWFREGRLPAAASGIVLALYVLIYFGRRGR